MFLKVELISELDKKEIIEIECEDYKQSIQNVIKLFKPKKILNIETSDYEIYELDSQNNIIKDKVAYDKRMERAEKIAAIQRSKKEFKNRG